MRTSSKGLALIKQFEGCRLTAYKCVSTEKYYTIGYGHYGADVKAGMKISQAQAEAYLVADLVKFENYVNNPAYCPITASLNQNQFDALVSFTYNCGAGNLKTLCKGRSAAQIAEHITLYNKSGGKVLTGLVRRREKEKALFLTGAQTSSNQAPQTSSGGLAKKLQGATNKSTAKAGSYKTTTGLNLRYGPGSDKYASMVVMPKGTACRCYGYFSKDSTGAVWLYVVATVNNKQYTGYAKESYLQK